MAVTSTANSSIKNSVKYNVTSAASFIPPSFRPNGYVAGGAGAKSVIDKFLLSNDSRTTLAIGLSVGREGAGGLASADNGYVGAGYPASGISSSIEKISLETDTVSTLAATIPSPARGLIAPFVSDTKGYFAGGNQVTSSRISTIEGLTFSNDAVARISATLSVGRQAGAGFYSNAAGYVAGGFDGGSHRNTVDKIQFSNETRSTITSLPATSAYGAGTQSDTNGYAAQGIINSGQPQTSTVFKLSFANDTFSTLGTGLSSARHGMTTFASDTNGYFAGSASPSLAIVDKFLFATDSRSTLATGLSVANSYASGFSG